MSNNSEGKHIYMDDPQLQEALRKACQKSLKEKANDDGNLRSFERLLEDEPEEQEAPVFLDATPDAIRKSIENLQACLPSGARITLTGVMDREGVVSDYTDDDPLFHIEISLYGGQK